MLAMQTAPPEILIVDAQPSHVAFLRQNLRQDDANEILRLGVSIEKALWRSYRNSVYRKSIFVNGRIAAMCGVYGSMLSDSGIVWLLTSNEVYRVSPLKFTRIYQEHVEEMLKVFDKLENYVDNEYTSAIRMLDIVGFNIGEPEPLGSMQKLYRKFWARK